MTDTEERIRLKHEKTMNLIDTIGDRIRGLERLLQEETAAHEETRRELALAWIKIDQLEGRTGK